MSRPPINTAVAVSGLAEAMRGERPAWVTPETWASLRASLDHARACALVTLEREGPHAAARAFKIDPKTLLRWRQGWLYESGVDTLSTEHATALIEGLRQRNRATTIDGHRDAEVALETVLRTLRATYTERAIRACVEADINARINAAIAFDDRHVRTQEKAQ